MEERLLKASKVEYIVVRPRGRRFKTQLWLIIGSVILILAGTAAWYFERNQSRRFKPLDLPTLGLRAGLKAKWVDGAAHYVFITKPLADREEGFRDLLQARSDMPYHFELKLLDKDGFKLCSSVPDLIRLHGKDGLITGLKAEQSFISCSEDEYGLAKRWDITYEGPRIGKNGLLAPLQDSTPTVKPKTPVQNSSTKAMSVAFSKLTGSDVEWGEIETIDKGSFRITRRAEYMTLIGWQPGADLKIDCPESVCVITNIKEDQSVHATKR